MSNTTSTTKTGLRFTRQQQEEWLQREAERQRLAETVFCDHDSLNVEAIRLLIAWAEEDEALLDRFLSWGKWYQGSWSSFENLDPDYESDRASVAEAARKAMLNGACETSYCMAGQAVLQAGYRMNYSHGYGTSSGSASTARLVEHAGFDDAGFPVVREVDREEPDAFVDIADKATRILGFNSRMADLFFESDNEITRLKELANQFSVEAGLGVMYPNTEVAAECLSDED